MPANDDKEAHDYARLKGSPLHGILIKPIFKSSEGNIFPVKFCFVVNYSDRYISASEHSHFPRFFHPSTLTAEPLTPVHGNSVELESSIQ